MGARHGHERHLSLIKNWISLSPAILPPAKLCRPSITHPDLHPTNVFVSTDSKTPSVTGVIDWQNAIVQPLFETVLPPFFKSTAMRSVHMESLRCAQHYSSHSYSDGLLLFEQMLMQICSSYGKEIPVHKDFPTCPISFTEEDRKHNVKELIASVQPEGDLNLFVFMSMADAGIKLEADGSVPKDQYEQAKQELSRIFARITANCTRKQVEEIKRLWPLREGKFNVSESCV
jgi:hypothetical protein